MTFVSISEAKARMAYWVELLKSGAVSEVIITKYGKPVARLLPAGLNEMDQMSKELA